MEATTLEKVGYAIGAVVIVLTVVITVGVSIGAVEIKSTQVYLGGK